LGNLIWEDEVLIQGTEQSEIGRVPCEVSVLVPLVNTQSTDAQMDGISGDVEKAPVTAVEGHSECSADDAGFV
jgi:hypothetical protein